MTKTEIKELINKKNENDVIEKLRKAYNNINYSEKELELNLLENETGFKYYNHSRKKEHYYFVSNIGRVLLVNMPSNELNVENEYAKDIFNYNCWVMPQNKDTLCLDIDWFKHEHPEFKEYILNSSTPVYTMIGEVWLSEEYQNMKKMYPDERIELHHIDGNNLNCTKDNLIYLPNHIHAVVHTKNNNS